LSIEQIVNSLKGTVQRKLTGDVSYINRGLPFALNTWYFIFKFKGNLLFKLKKNGFSGISKICGLSISMGRCLQITDNWKPTN
jgi:hypothetical protein